MNLDSEITGGDHTFHTKRHIRCLGDFGCLRDFPYLEHIDAKDFLCAQVEQQDLHFVRARQFGAGVNIFHQGFVADISNHMHFSPGGLAVVMAHLRMGISQNTADGFRQLDWLEFCNIAVDAD